MQKVVNYLEVYPSIGYARLLFLPVNIVSVMSGCFPVLKQFLPESEITVSSLMLQHSDS